MANNFKITNAVAIAMADVFDVQANAGTAAVIEIRTGSQPADPDSAATGTLLATLVMDATAFGAATDGNPGGLLTAASIADDSSADATGTAGYFRMLTQTGGTAIADGECGTSGADLNLNTLSITSGSTVSITSMTVTMPES